MNKTKISIAKDSEKWFGTKNLYEGTRPQKRTKAKSNKSINQFLIISKKHVLPQLSENSNQQLNCNFIFARVISIIFVYTAYYLVFGGDQRRKRRDDKIQTKTRGE